MTQRLLPVAILLAAAFAGCETESSDAVDQSRIYTAYELFYDKAENQTTAVATFRFGNALGTQLELSSPSSVRFNGETLDFNPVLGRYEKTYPGQWLINGTFAFTDTEGNSYTNAVADTMRSAEFPDQPPVLQLTKSVDNVVLWNGTPLQTNEQVGALLIGTAKVFGTNNPGAVSFTAFKSLLADVTNGNYTLVMDRWLTLTPTQAPEAGGTIVLKYRAASKNVNVTD